MCNGTVLYRRNPAPGRWVLSGDGAHQSLTVNTRCIQIYSVNNDNSITILDMIKNGLAQTDFCPWKLCSCKASPGKGRPGIIINRY